IATVLEGNIESFEGIFRGVDPRPAVS
ncbi:MAG: hypothetical protein JWN45_1011, partial [Acidobacteriaceae bacterium]|nr:hypothetical protein [Acidobacteriaceae bacterium]